jgi:hypothetical protein
MYRLNNACERNGSIFHHDTKRVVLLTRSEGVLAAKAVEAPRASKVREMFLINIVGEVMKELAIFKL